MVRETFVLRDGKLIPKHLAPPRHSAADGVQIIRDIEPYRNVIDQKVVGGRRQHREFLRQHGVVEVGNERPQPKQWDDRAHERSIDQTMRRVLNGQ